MIGCLIIHGYTGSPSEVKPLTDYLREYTNFRIEVPTLPGHGKMLELDNPSYREWIRKAEKSLETLANEVDRIFVIGFSMGGMIAAYLASKYEVEKLVLLATAGKYLSFTQLGREIGEVIKDGLTGNLEENVFFQNYKTKRGDIPLKANIEFMRLVRFTRKHLKDVESPVLIAQGHLDSLVPYKTAYYLEKEIKSKHKEVILFDQSKHQICLGEDKDTLNAIVHQFLTTNNESVQHTLD